MLRHLLTTLAVGASLACVSRPAVPIAPAAAATVTSTSLATAPDRYFTSADARLRFREVGRGEPVVLVHGLGRSLDDWSTVADSLARDHRVIALDVRGFGRSTRFSDPARLGAEMANDVVRLLDHLGIRRAHLGGHSMGALVAADLAARHPDRVLSVTLLAGPFYEQPGTFAKDESGFAADVEQGRGMHKLIKWLFPNAPDSVVAAWNAETMRANDAATIGAALRSMDALQVYPSAARRIRAPALVVIGGNDPLGPQSRWLASWWPRARLLELPQDDHFTILFSPEVVRAMRSQTAERRAA